METKNEQMSLANGLVPAIPVHPGIMLGEELKARGIRQKDFARAIGIQATHLSAMIHGTRSITPAVAVKLEQGLEGIPARIWLRMQERYNLDAERARLGLRPSQCVSGYSPSQVGVRALAEPESAYDGKICRTVFIPADDAVLFDRLAERMGWKVE